MTMRGWAWAAAAGALAASAAAGTMSVQVREAPVRDTPSFLGKVSGTLAYGDQVEVRQTQGAWSQVSRGGVSGWLHASALSAKRIVLAAGQEQARVAASGDELALAGKGFNSDVEKAFKAQNAKVDFTWIDYMETIRIPAAAQQAFLREGGVTPREGGAR